eukprot:4259900-Pleurochrysis_carterae.AAC.1
MPHTRSTSYGVRPEENARKHILSYAELHVSRRVCCGGGRRSSWIRAGRPCQWWCRTACRAVEDELKGRITANPYELASNESDQKQHALKYVHALSLTPCKL